MSEQELGLKKYILKTNSKEYIFNLIKITEKIDKIKNEQELLEIVELLKKESHSFSDKLEETNIKKTK